MPKIKGGKCVGQRRKNHRKKSAAERNSKKEFNSGDHSYSKEAVYFQTPTVRMTTKDGIVEDRPEVDIQSSEENELQSTNTEEDKQWDVAWRNFFIEDVSDMDLQSAAAHEETDTDHFANEHYVVLHKIFKFSPNDDLDELVLRLRIDRRYQLFRSLQENLQKRFNVIGNFWVSKCTDKVIQLIWLYDVDVPSVKFVLNITVALAPTLYVHRIVLDPNPDFWIGLPKHVMLIADLERIASKLESWDVCTGNYETEYVNTMPLWTTAHDISSNAQAYREGDFCAVRGEISYHSTVRSSKCCLLTVKYRCTHCDLYSHTLRKKVWRENQRPASSFIYKKNTPNKHMSKDMMIRKMSAISDSAKSVKRELDTMRRKVSNIIGVEGQKLSDIDSLELTNLLKAHTSPW